MRTSSIAIALLLAACRGGGHCTEELNSYEALYVYDTEVDGGYTLPANATEILRFGVDAEVGATGADAIFVWLDSPEGLGARQVDCVGGETLVELDLSGDTQTLEASCVDSACLVEVCIEMFTELTPGSGDFVVQIAPYAPLECGEEAVFLDDAPVRPLPADSL